MASEKTRAKLTEAVDRRQDRYQRQLTKPVAQWLDGLRRKLLREQLKQLKPSKIKLSGKIKLRKASAQQLTDAELMRIFAMFGVRQISNSGKPVAVAFGGEWVISPGLLNAIIKEKAVKIKNLRADIEQAVKEKTREIMFKASKEIPQPSVAELSRRIRKALNRLDAFSIGRAARIARTEAVQNNSAGINHGMKIAGVDEIQWISSKNPNHGDRHHERMNNKKVKLGEKFINRTTKRKLRFPGDPLAHISETVNCGCTFKPTKIKRKRKRA